MASLGRAAESRDRGEVGLRGPALGASQYPEIVEPEAPDRPGIGIAGKFFLVVIAALVAAVLLWMLIGWVLGWFFGVIKLAVFIGAVIAAGWVFLRFKTRGD